MNIKIFMWFLHRNVADMQEMMLLCFWENYRTSISHRPFCQIVCHIVYMTYNIHPPDNLKNMFRNLLIGIDRKLRREYVLACLFMLVSLEMYFVWTLNYVIKRDVCIDWCRRRGSPHLKNLLNILKLYAVQKYEQHCFAWTIHKETHVSFFYGYMAL